MQCKCGVQEMTRRQENNMYYWHCLGCTRNHISQAFILEFIKFIYAGCQR